MFITVQFSRLVCPTLCDPMDWSMPGLPVHHQLPGLTQTHVHWVGDAIQPSHLLSSPSLPTFNLPSIVFLSNESVLHNRWPNFGVSASASVLSMNIQDWFPLGLIGWISLQSKGLSRVFSKPQLKTINSLVLSFFIVQLSHPYMTTGKTIALTRQTFVCKVTSLHFNMLPRLVIAFLPRSKHLNFMAAVTICSDFAAQKNSLSLFPLFPHLFAWSDGTRRYDLSFLNVEF